MFSDKKCKQCRRTFNPARRNQVFCSIKCRHAFGNETFRKKTARFEADKQNAIKQNMVLQSLFRPNRRIIIAEMNFRQLGINILNAKTCILRADGTLLKAVFTNFSLERFDDQTFELKEL